MGLDEVGDSTINVVLDVFQSPVQLIGLNILFSFQGKV